MKSKKIKWLFMSHPQLKLKHLQNGEVISSVRACRLELSQNEIWIDVTDIVHRPGWHRQIKKKTNDLSDTGNAP